MDAPNPTALITGASSGIGVDFAGELAQRGYDLILSARRRERLEQLKSDLEKTHAIRVELITADLNQPTGAEQLFEEVCARQASVSFLINNAGLGQFGEFTSQALGDIQATMQVNMTALTVLTRLFAAQMVAAGRGYILNTGSFSAIQPTPDYAVYSGTKAFVLAFSQALNHQLSKKNVRVCALCPGFFESDFFENSGQQKSMLVKGVMLHRRSVARAGIAGVLRGRSIVIPGIRYKLLNLLTRLTPRTFATELADFAVKH